MTTTVIVGAGMMGTAMCWPLADNQHQVRLIGTPLDRHIIDRLQQDRFHLTLQRRIPDGVTAHPVDALPDALQDADLVISGVSSFGVDWFAGTVGPNLRPDLPLLAVTKGLQDLEDGSLISLPAALDRKLPAALHGRCSLNAIGGPCIAHELAARRQTGVVFCGQDSLVLERLREMLATPYYHIWTSTDLTGVETCAALKNAYALGIALAAGMGEAAGPDGLARMYNPQAALFAQSLHEMRGLLRLVGASPDPLTWLPGAGDLYVTVFGGRTRQLGILLGMGRTFEQARAQLSGVTLESVEIIQRVFRALRLQAARGSLDLEQFPLLVHLHALLDGEQLDIPWEKFYK